MQKSHPQILIGFFVLTLAMIACNAPGISNPGAIATSTLIDGNILSQPPNPSLGQVAGGACDNPYYPIIAGATWTYSLTGPVTDTFTRSIIAVSSDGFTDQDVFGTGVTRSGLWKCEAGSLIGLDPGGNSGATANVQTDNLNASFQTTSMEGVSFPAVIDAGTAWSQSFTIEGTQSINGQDIASKNQTTNSCTVGGNESISVPAGTFSAVRVDCQTSMTITIVMNGAEIPTSINLTSTTWHAEGVGMVKTASTLSDGSVTTIELTAYSIP